MSSTDNEKHIDGVEMASCINNIIRYRNTQYAAKNDIIGSSQYYEESYNTRHLDISVSNFIYINDEDSETTYVVRKNGPNVNESSILYQIRSGDDNLNINWPLRSIKPLLVVNKIHESKSEYIREFIKYIYSLSKSIDQKLKKPCILTIR